MSAPSDEIESTPIAAVSSLRSRFEGMSTGSAQLSTANTPRSSVILSPGPRVRSTTPTPSDIGTSVPEDVFATPDRSLLSPSPTPSTNNSFSNENTRRKPPPPPPPASRGSHLNKASPAVGTSPIMTPTAMHSPPLINLSTTMSSVPDINPKLSRSAPVPPPRRHAHDPSSDDGTPVTSPGRLTPTISHEKLSERPHAPVTPRRQYSNESASSSRSVSGAGPGPGLSPKPSIDLLVARKPPPPPSPKPPPRIHQAASTNDVFS
jgi:hypothetical protein